MADRELDPSITDIMLGREPMFGPDVDAKEAERKQAEKTEFRRQFLIWLIENPDFRTWLMEILLSFGTFENAFGQSEAGFPDPLATQFRLGMKQAGWRLWTIFDDVSPELASLMRREWSAPKNQSQT